MIHQVVSVRDLASGLLGRIFQVAAKGQAIRSFQDEVNNPQGGDLNKHPEDFELWLLGTFDDVTGVFESELQLIVRGKDIRNASQSVG